MASIIGYTNYSNNRVNSIDTTSEKDEFGKWLHTPNFRAVKTATAQAVEGRNEKISFATLLKQADQDNQKAEKVELRPNNLLGKNLSNIDILA
ncbi:MAG TPA: hypothetical protein DCM27_08310 [Rhodospirillaceae bacterium]|nr:hypothetical protein [Rhodospirillaceae bacterium]